jgi:hypothetical protein
MGDSILGILVKPELPFSNIQWYVLYVAGAVGLKETRDVSELP